MSTQPVAYYCDHRHLDRETRPHYSVEIPEDGSGYQIQRRPEVHTALEFADQRHRPAELRDFHCPSAQPLYLPVSRLIETARRALGALDDLIANTYDPGVEALGARYELAQALGQLSPYERPLDEPGFVSGPQTTEEATR
ncbi:hypothetical protein ACGF07_25685 [Kitasatospora sp. NPDC048194]|uniref:hypothetical protein n=1 Tax=Kitasatospora sp. NPDC048194 TaxID=3364045 RepID=UPI00371F3E16